jgi:hypothetical protein
LAGVGELGKRRRQAGYRTTFLVDGDQGRRQTLIQASVAQFAAEAAKLVSVTHITPKEDEIGYPAFPDQLAGRIIDLKTGNPDHENSAHFRSREHLQLHIISRSGPLAKKSIIRLNAADRTFYAAIVLICRLLSVDYRVLHSGLGKTLEP